jgi:hypothetical protein
LQAGDPKNRREGSRVGKPSRGQWVRSAQAIGFVPEWAIGFVPARPIGFVPARSIGFVPAWAIGFVPAWAIGFVPVLVGLVGLVALDPPYL